MSKFSSPTQQGADRYQLELDTLFATSRLRQLVPDHANCINFSANDYLGLAHDSRLAQAAMEATQQFGTSASSSRLITGTSDLILGLEQQIARWKNAEAALVFNSGYQANVAILQALLSGGDEVFCDRLNHASLIDGCQLSGAKLRRYRHLDLNHLESLLQQSTATIKWIVTDSVFSMDGDYPDLVALTDLAIRYNAFTLIDEAHATGIYGAKKSAGLCEQFGVSDRVSLQMGTFSKALGGFGAYVAGSRTLIDTLINQARGLIYSTALPPGVIAAAAKAIEIVQHDPEPKAKLWENIRLTEELLQTPVLSPIIPVPVGDTQRVLALSEELLKAGYRVHAIRPPTVPEKTDRLRVSLSARHTADEIRGLVSVLEKTGCLGGA